MKVFDRIENCEKDLTAEQLMELLAKHNRQVDLVLSGKKTDEDGYQTWDRENWVCVDGKRFIRSYLCDGRALSEYSGFNKYDMKGTFLPEEAAQVILG